VKLSETLTRGIGNVIVGIIISLALLILGFILRSGKGDWLISGYNTLSEKEKNQYDRVAVCKFTGNLIISFAIIFFIIVICDRYIKSSYKNILVIVLIALGVIVMVGGVIYANTGNKFLKKQ
jgi:amino acid permease